MIAVILQWLGWFFVPIFFPQAGTAGILGGLALGLGVLVWWLLFSRAPWLDRLGAVALMVLAVFPTSRLVHESIADGMMGLMLPIYAVPVMSLALVAWAFASRRLSTGSRGASLVGAVLLACGVMTLVRTAGVTGDGVSDLHWRWTATPEERLLARPADDAIPPAPASTAAGASGEREPTQADVPTMAPAAGSTEVETVADWPGFRGADRDSVISGIRIDPEWSRSPPVELWRRPVGPGWSSFAVHGALVYTQEQRGDDEIVSCYDLTTGEAVWTHRDAARFWESNAGAGPRGTPTLSDGRIYTFGATGILNALDARDGSLIWSHDAAADTGTAVPHWGFASSPLVVGDLVIIATAGALAAYDLATGEPRWFGPAGESGYSSPHLAMIDGVAQVLLLNGSGAISVAPTDGSLLWTHSWPGDGIVQPAMAGDLDVLLGSGSGLTSAIGMRRITVANGPAGWTVVERWTSAGLKPYYNDFVVHEGHAIGFDGSILSCIDLADGQRKWKGGRYGHGQLVLLSDQDLLLVVSEEGELALVEARPDRFVELARYPALTGKTWNHPVLVGEVLLLRNDREMAAFRLSPEGG